MTDTTSNHGELIHHSDAGSQYTAIHLSEHLALEGIAPSIGSVGDAYDNALMETVNGLFKTEFIRTTIFHAGPYPDPLRRRVRDCRLGRLVQQLPSPRLTRDADPGRVRDAPLRGPRPRARTRKVAAENPGRFILART